MHGVPEADSLAVIDVGGGSTEVSTGKPGEIPEWWNSLPIGSAMLALQCLKSDPPAQAEIAACREAAARAVTDLEVPKVDAALAVGGSATSLRRLAGPKLDEHALAEALATLSHLSANQVAMEHTIDVRRVRLLPAGIAILAAVTSRIGLPLQVARGGLREGALLRLAESQS
jgi:exopolyphosphatase/guanosine-5'-triphosphate,3'-diphosphate pyrophosphatase